TFEGQSRVDVLDTATGKTTTLPDRLWRADAPSPYAWLETLAWSPDGKRLAFNAAFDAYPAEVVLTEWQDGKPLSTLLKRPDGVSIRGYGTPLLWSGNEQLLYLGEQKAQVALRSVTVREGKSVEDAVLTPGDRVVTLFSFTNGGVAVYGT